MPTYEYKCDNCGHFFEKFQMMSANPLKKCPQCGKMKLKRLIGTGSGIIFKGSGFYETDYRSDSYKQGKASASSASSTSSSTSSSSSASSTASKPAESKSKSKKETPKKAGSKSAPAKKD